MSRGRQPLPPGFGTIWTTVALDLVGFGIVLPILPLYAQRYGASPAMIGALVASFSFAQLVCAPLLGRLSDRIGRRPVLLLSLVGTAVGSLLTGLAPGLALLFVGRLLDGASGASVSVAQAAVVDVAAPEERARLLGLLSAAFGVGFVVGPALGALAALGGPRLPFLLAAAVAALNALRAHRHLPETRRPQAGVVPPAPSARRRRRTGPLLLVMFASVAAFAAFEATFALYGEARLGFTIGSTGAVFAFAGVVVALSSGGLVHPAVARFGNGGTLRLALLLNVLGLGVLALASTWTATITGLAVLAVGQGLVAPTLAALVADRTEERRRGGALGIQQAAGGLARIAGPLLGGAAFELGGSGAPMVAGAALTAAAAVAVWARVRVSGASAETALTGVRV